jgi:hypothetical protein
MRTDPSKAISADGMLILEKPFALRQILQAKTRLATLFAVGTQKLGAC